MRTLNEIKKRNNAYWNVIILEHEAELLVREQNHLEKKSKQRPLTAWEESRLFDILTETNTIMREIAFVAKSQRQIIR